MTEPTFERRVTLDRGHDSGIEPHPRVKAEMTTIHRAEADPIDRSLEHRFGQGVGCRDRIVLQADRASEHVGGAARKHPEGRVGARYAGRHLIEGAIATEGDDRVEAPSRSVIGEACGVPSAVRLDDFDVMVATQATVHHDGIARRHR